MMKAIEIHTFTELHEIIDTYDARTVTYRGMKSVKYPLIPKIGRIVPPDSIGSREVNEKEILRLFKERALRFLDFMPTTDCWTGRIIRSSPAILQLGNGAKMTA